MQAPDYARAEAEAEGVPAGLLDRAGQATAARLQAIRHRETPRVSVILGQEALCRLAGGQAIARAQLLALARACEDDGNSPQPTIQVLPPGSASHPGISADPASILLFAPPPAPGLVHVPTLHGSGLFLDDPDAVTGFTRAFTHLRSLALSPAESATLLTDYAKAE